MHNKLKPGLDGSPLEICLELVLGDYAPEEAAEHISQLIELTREPPQSAEHILRCARTILQWAASVDSLENLGDSLQLIKAAKTNLRDVALLWLQDRQCQCCIDMRYRLEQSAKETE